MFERPTQNMKVVGPSATARLRASLSWRTALAFFGPKLDASLLR
jgi:hypothetical protein